MSAIREALEAAGIPFERPKPSETYECLKVRYARQPAFRPGERAGLSSHRRITKTHKWCPMCEQWLALDSFSRSESQPNGYRSYCRPCENAYNARRARKQVA